MNKKKRVLVVDDSVENLEIAELILKKHHCDVTLVDNGQDAINAVERMDVSIILMDIRMPGVDGVETTKMIRQFNKDVLIFAYSTESKNMYWDDKKRILAIR